MISKLKKIIGINRDQMSLKYIKFIFPLNSTKKQSRE